MFLVIACGGRFQQPTGGDDDTGGTSANQGGTGTTPSGGTGAAGRAGSASTAGVGSGGSGCAGAAYGGASAAGGAIGTGGACTCPAIACAPRYQPVPNPDGCCFHCERDQCSTEQDNYAVFRQELLKKYSDLGCMTDPDCTTYYDKTACGTSCGAPLPLIALKEVDSALSSFAQTTCPGDCPVPPIEPCLPPPHIVCQINHCVYVAR